MHLQEMVESCDVSLFESSCRGTLRLHQHAAFIVPVILNTCTGCRLHVQTLWHCQSIDFGGPARQTNPRPACRLLVGCQGLASILNILQKAKMMDDVWFPFGDAQGIAFFAAFKGN